MIVGGRSSSLLLRLDLTSSSPSSSSTATEVKRNKFNIEDWEYNSVIMPKSGPTTYTLASNEASSTTSTRSKKSKLHHHLNKKHHHHHHHGGSDASEDPVDPTDGNGSLTYSAASSVQSGGSAAGESTDSSFADIMRVLDLQDSSELKALIKKEGVSSERELREKRGLPFGTSGVSVASSLNYSTDGESALDGSGLLQTIAG